MSSLRCRFPSGIPRCGADALRFALLRHDVLASDVAIDVPTLASEGLRFVNHFEVMMLVVPKEIHLKKDNLKLKKKFTVLSC